MNPMNNPINDPTQTQSGHVNKPGGDGVMDPAAHARAADGNPAATRPKLDLTGLEPPTDLEECSIEEMTIDGICGVY